MDTPGMTSAYSPSSKKRIIGLAALARSGKDTVAGMLLEHGGVAAYALADPLKAGCQVLFGLSDEQAWGDECKEIAIERWRRSPRRLFQRVGTEWMRGHDPDHWLMRAERELLCPAHGHDAGGARLGDPDAVFRLGAQAIFGLSAAQTWEREAGDVEDLFWRMTPNAMFGLLRRYALSDYPDFMERRRALPVTPPTRRARIEPHTDVLVLKDIRFENEAGYIRRRGGQVWHIRRSTRRIDDHSSEHGIAIAPGDVVIDNNGTLDQLARQVEQAWHKARAG
ncbi:MAG: deoxynucleotide monophosphate kinase [Alcaligenaceae bacterium]|nr:deoxynucleotide monophosphate kinase [Alcaligenaceae bacterium]